MEWIHVFTIIGVFISVLVALLIPIYKILNNHIHNTEAKIDSLRDELRTFKAETNQRFEKIDQRFEEQSKRFDTINQRFDTVISLVTRNQKA